MKAEAARGRYESYPFGGVQYLLHKKQLSTMAAPKDERISVPIDDPNADTEWYASFTLGSLFLIILGTTSCANTA